MQREHAARAHVLDPFVHVVAARPHLVERGRVYAVLRLGPARDRVEADVGDGLAVEDPHVVAGVGVLDPGARSANRAGIRPSNMCGGSTTWSSTLMKIMSSTRMAPRRSDGRREEVTRASVSGRRSHAESSQFNAVRPRGGARHAGGPARSARARSVVGDRGPARRVAARRAGRRRDQGRAARRRPVPRLQRLRGVEPVAALGDRRSEAARRGRRVPQASRPTPTCSSRRSGPGVTDRLGIGFDALHELNPRLVYCRARRIPTATASRNAPVTTRSCRRAAASNGSSPAGGPARSSCTCRCRAWARCSSCPTGIITALIARESTGRGQHVRTSLFQGALLYTTQIWTWIPAAGTTFYGTMAKTYPPGVHQEMIFEVADNEYVHSSIMSGLTPVKSQDALLGLARSVGSREVHDALARGARRAHTEAPRRVQAARA